MTREPLPIDGHVAAVVDALARHRAAVLVAAPGAGKTTRVPPALVARGRVLVLQPRRVAVRAVAQRIAAEHGWTIGREVGWHIRFERRFAAETPLVVVTEGILTARLHQDPLLSDVSTVVLDEFHERSIHADLGLALVRQAWLARDDLRVLVMSATIDPAPVARFLDGCPVVDVPGVTHPLRVDYAPGESVATAVRAVWPAARGHVLCFLPGAREIARARQELDATPPLDAEILPLHGSLDAAAQDAAIRPSDRRRVILATNLAETSLTVPGVATVVDSGLVKVARYDAERGIDQLVTERVTLDSADQRAGRAARLGPGRVRRLWDARDRLRPTREPELTRIDLSSAVLDVLAWGADPRTFEWFERPPATALDAALTLLARLGAVSSPATTASRVGPPALTDVGRRLQRLPLPPRIARILIEGGGDPRIALACALLADGRTASSSQATTTCDLLGLLDRPADLPPAVHAIARDLERHGDGPRRADGDWERRLRRALHAGYADRLARRRAGGSDRLVLASGHGAVLGRESGVREGEFLVALDVVAASRDGVTEARVRSASLVDTDWITPTSTSVTHRLHRASGAVRAMEVARVDALTVTERPVAVDPGRAAELLAEAWLAAERDEADVMLLRRLRFAGLEVDLASLVREAAGDATRLGDIDLAAHLPRDVRVRLEAAAPTAVPVPSGRTASLLYGDDGSVTAAVKLQELFGLAETPLLGPRRVPVTFSLLAPNGRAVQTTRDLRSFWRGAYQEVRRELRGRYPRHPWPEDPWTATPTHRTIKGSGKSRSSR
jgi:ATP-dependent helicase HrpB